MTDGKKANPKVEKYFLFTVKDELFALANFMRHQWYVVAGVVVLLVLVANLYNPLPHGKITIASGQPNSTIEVIAKKYQRYFEKNGITVELMETRGAIENLASLVAGKADVALSQGGAPLNNARGIVSLGSIGYQPLWFFYRGEAFDGVDLISFLAGKTISVGLPGSGTRLVVDAIVDTLAPQTRGKVIFTDLPASDSVGALLNGRIDGMFLVAGIESGNVQALLNAHGVRFYNFMLADALTKYLPYAEVVNIPRGGVSLSPVVPAVDTRMIATTTTILARETLHPAIQYLFVKASAEMDRKEPAFFDRPGGFPAFIDKGTPRSDVAHRYLTRGSLLLEGYVPYWLASFFSRAWFWILASIALIYPLLKMLPSYRKTIFDVIASDKYSQIFQIYRAADTMRTREEHDELLRKFRDIEKHVKAMWTPKGRIAEYSNLLNAIALLREKLKTVAPPAQ